ncbi:hypothetical protein MHYP_G00226880 [Metynnis hypsauchen]
MRQTLVAKLYSRRRGLSGGVRDLGTVPTPLAAVVFPSSPVAIDLFLPFLVADIFLLPSFAAVVSTCLTTEKNRSAEHRLDSGSSGRSRKGQRACRMTGN